jgi:hypothetical protein
MYSVFVSSDVKLCMQFLSLPSMHQPNLLLFFISLGGVTTSGELLYNVFYGAVV